MNAHSFTLTLHASHMVQERQIDLRWIQDVLSSPEKLEPDKVDPQLRHALGRIAAENNRVLRVVYNETEEPWRVVTVYFDRGQRGKL